MKTIIVFFDSLNRRFLSSYNDSAPLETPNFTRLSKNSVKFTNSYVGSMPCIPARRELHTGRYNFLHREWGPLEPFDDSMPEILKNNGIYTHLVTDHLHYFEDGGATFHTRYNSFEIVRGEEGDHWKGEVKDPDIPDVVMIPKSHDGSGASNLWRYDWINRKYIRREEDFPQTKTFDFGIEFIEKNHNEDNWLLQIETFDPHEPFYAPEKYREKFSKNYRGKHFDWPRGKANQTKEEIEHCIDEYKATLSMCDYNLGKVLDMMDKYDMWKDTLLIVGTDHGFLLGEHGYWGKNTMPYYNEIANTPFFIWDPISKIKDEGRSDIVQMIDWAPTILDFYSLDIPKDMEGRSIFDSIRKKKKLRDFAIFGVFSGHVNITDGECVYMKSAINEKKDDIYNYTLIPLHMNKRFTVEELKTAKLSEPFSFTKGLKVLKIKSKEKYCVCAFGDLLYNIKNDPFQTAPLQDHNLEAFYKKAIIKKMKENDSPKEQFDRLGL